MQPQQQQQQQQQNKKKQGRDADEPTPKRVRKSGTFDLWADQKLASQLHVLNRNAGRGHETTKAKVVKKIPAVLLPIAGESVK